MADQEFTSPSQGEFKPNIYPVMYWALAYGATAGVALFIMYLLSRFITILWFPVFLAGLIWGAFRNYKQQKLEWHSSQGMATPVAGSMLEEMREAATDIFNVSRDMAQQEQAEAVAQEEAAIAEQEEYIPEEESAVAPEETPEIVQPEEQSPLQEPSLPDDQTGTPEPIVTPPATEAENNPAPLPPTQPPTNTPPQPL